MVGYKTVAGGNSDPECTHVILTLDEYNELHQRISAAINRENNAKITAINAAKNAEAEIKEIQTEAEQQIEQIEKQLENEREAKLYQMGLNKRLLEISRERANADRKIKPKKQRSGYAVMSSRQKKYRYKKNRHDMAEVYLWETVIQTPYVVAFSAEQAMNETQELFARDEQGDMLIGRLGIAGEYGGKYEDMISDSRYATWSDYNTIVEKTYNANAKAGYWEIIITHTKPLDNIGIEL